jgi:hypothetical protein
LPASSIRYKAEAEERRKDRWSRALVGDRFSSSYPYRQESYIRQRWLRNSEICRRRLLSVRARKNACDIVMAAGLLSSFNQSAASSVKRQCGSKQRFNYAVVEFTRQPIGTEKE